MRRAAPTPSITTSTRSDAIVYGRLSNEAIMALFPGNYVS
jgi:hypothetical protein